MHEPHHGHDNVYISSRCGSYGAVKLAGLAWVGVMPHCQALQQTQWQRWRGAFRYIPMVLTSFVSLCFHHTSNLLAGTFGLLPREASIWGQASPIVQKTPQTLLPCILGQPTNICPVMLQWTCSKRPSIYRQQQRPCSLMLMSLLGC